MDKKRKEEILEIVKKVGSEEYIVSRNAEGAPITLKKKSKVSQGKKSRQAGAQFELRVRKDLEEKGWVVDKWSNNFDLEKNKIIPAKRKFNPFKKVMTIGTGFPDFVATKFLGDKVYSIIGVEVKMNGLLSKIEKEKCKAFLDKKVFSEILVASKEKDGRKILIKYKDVKERYKNLFK